MPQCQNCGGAVPETDRFCPQCGAPLAQGTGAPPPDASPPVPQAGPNTGLPAPPPPAPAPPGAPVAQAGVPRKKGLSRGAKIAIVLGVLALVLIAVTVVLLVVVFMNVISGPADASNNYVRALNEGDMSTAWSYLSTSTQRDEGRSGFESKVGIFKGEISDWNTTSIEIKNSSAQVVMDLKFKDGTEATWDMYLVKEGGEWKIAQVTPRS